MDNSAPSNNVIVASDPIHMVAFYWYVYIFMHLPLTLLTRLSAAVTAKVQSVVPSETIDLVSAYNASFKDFVSTTIASGTLLASQYTVSPLEDFKTLTARSYGVLTTVCGDLHEIIASTVANFYKSMGGFVIKYCAHMSYATVWFKIAQYVVGTIGDNVEAITSCYTQVTAYVGENVNTTYARGGCAAIFYAVSLAFYSLLPDASRQRMIDTVSRTSKLVAGFQNTEGVTSNLGIEKVIPALIAETAITPPTTGTADDTSNRIPVVGGVVDLVTHLTSQFVGSDVASAVQSGAVQLLGDHGVQEAIIEVAQVGVDQLVKAFPIEGTVVAHEIGQILAVDGKGIVEPAISQALESEGITTDQIDKGIIEASSFLEHVGEIPRVQTI